MKIKLNRDLWNHKKGEEIEVPDPNAIWAIKKGYAGMVEIEPIKGNIKISEAENKAITPKYKRNANKAR
jgi:hypothetical protein